MNITVEGKPLIVCTILGLLFTILSDFNVIEFSIAQQQEENQT
jgi:hypothetical protein